MEVADLIENETARREHFVLLAVLEKANLAQSSSNHQCLCVFYDPREIAAFAKTKRNVIFFLVHWITSGVAVTRDRGTPVVRTRRQVGRSIAKAKCAFFNLYQTYFARAVTRKRVGIGKDPLESFDLTSVELQ